MRAPRPLRQAQGLVRDAAQERPRLPPRAPLPRARNQGCGQPPRRHPAACRQRCARHGARLRGAPGALPADRAACGESLRHPDGRTPDQLASPGSASPLLARQWRPSRPSARATRMGSGGRGDGPHALRVHARAAAPRGARQVDQLILGEGGCDVVRGCHFVRGQGARMRARPEQRVVARDGQAADPACAGTPEGKGDAARPRRRSHRGTPGGGGARVE